MLSQMEASFRVILKAVKGGGHGFMVEIAEMGVLGRADPRLTTWLPSGVEALLEEYQKLFASPQGLPPKRSHDHAIGLV